MTITIFGESHGTAVGAVLDGLAPGIAIDEDFIASQMDKRRAVGSLSTARHEPDRVRIVSGVFNGKTTGTPITFIIENSDTKSRANLLTRHAPAMLTLPLRQNTTARRISEAAAISPDASQPVSLQPVLLQYQLCGTRGYSSELISYHVQESTTEISSLSVKT